MKAIDDDGDNVRTTTGMNLGLMGGGNDGVQLMPIDVRPDRSCVLSAREQRGQCIVQLGGRCGHGGVDIGGSVAGETIGEGVARAALGDQVAEEAEEGVAGIGAANQTRRHAHQRRHARRDRGVDQRGLGGEVTMHRACADPRLTGDLVDRNVEPARLEGFGGRSADLAAIDRRIRSEASGLA